MEDKPISIRLNQDMLEELDKEADDRNISRTELIRELIEKGREYDQLEAERDRLQRKLSKTNERNDKVTELVEKQDYDQWVRRQPITKRMKWKLTGLPDREEIEDE